MKRLLIFGLAVGLAPALPPALAQEETLISFEIKDQFDREHSGGELLDRAAVILVSDRKGSGYSGAWERGIADALAAAGGAEEVRIVPAAHLRGVPFFVRSRVKSSFSRDESSPVLLDWRGEFAKAYGFEKERCNIFAFDSAGLLVHRMAVTEVDPEAIDDLLARLGVGSPR